MYSEVGSRYPDGVNRPGVWMMVAEPEIMIS